MAVLRATRRRAVCSAGQMLLDAIYILAAYGMAIELDKANGFAWYNSAVIHFNTGNPTEAADAFYGAGLAYLKTRDYAKAERALTDLKDIAKSGIPVQTKVRTIEDALSDLSRRKT